MPEETRTSQEEIFSEGLLATLETLVRTHHSIYPDTPPQGIYFEALVEKAFKLNRKPFEEVASNIPNAPQHDLVVRGERISLKTETGRGTRLDRIHITKLCTTERDPWEPRALVEHAMAHLGRYEHILMLRAIWDRPVIDYQLVDIPVSLLRRLADVVPEPVGKRRSRRSLGADVADGGTVIFHVHFDGSDGKCQITNLRVSECRLLREWQLQITD